MPDLAWDIRDILGAPRRGLSGRSVLVGMEATAFAGMVLTVFTYLGVILDGALPFGHVVRQVHILPWLSEVRLGPMGRFAIGSGRIIAGITLLYGLVAACKLAFRRLKGDEGFRARDAWAFAWRRGHALVRLLSLIVAGLLLIVVYGLVAGLAGRMPVVGEIVLALALIPGLVLVVVGAALLVVGGGAAVIGPAAVGTLGDDWLDALIHVAAIMWAEWRRFVLYECALLALTVLAGCAAVVVLFGGLHGALVLCGALVPQKAFGVVISAAEYVPGLGSLLLRVMPHTFVFSYEVTPSLAIAGGVTALVIGALAFSACGYVVSVWAYGQTLVYIVLCRRHLGQNLVEREDDRDRLAALSEAGRVPDDAPEASENPPGASDLIHIETKREESS